MHCDGLIFHRKRGLVLKMVRCTYQHWKRDYTQQRLPERLSHDIMNEYTLLEVYLI